MSMYDHYFSNFGSPPVPDDICKDSAIRHVSFWRRRFLKVFPIQMHREANLTVPQKGQTSMYDNSFSNFGRPPVPDDSCKGSAPRYSRFWRRRFLKVFTIIWAWRPSWSTDCDHFMLCLNIIMFYTWVQNCMHMESFFNKILNVKHG